MRLSLRQMRYALAAGRHENLTLAGNELNVSQPSISVAISQIEDVLGQQLFVRQRGAGVSLTPFGRAVLARAARIVADMEELEGLAFDEGALFGEVVVGCFEDLAPYCAPALLHRLKERHPHIRATVREESFHALGRRLVEGAIDIALTYNIALPPDVEVEVLRTLEPYALLPADHPLTRGKSVSLAELARYSLVLSDQEDSWKYILGLFQLHDLSPSVLGKMRSFEMQRSMVANGFGVAVAYTSPFGDYAYDGKPLVHRPITDRLPLQQVLVAYDARRPLSRAARGFISEARDWFSSQCADPVRARQSDGNVQ